MKQINETKILEFSDRGIIKFEYKSNMFIA